ncbi:hypothetical protein [uncultured Nocardioides sp.]|uniref:hypothetical protein n=1 Tax=uncultured Nocardioides sp. TaxID=198441 RepID=UPI002639378C|nr:hypothetical protein [uncultured Nocardioides sp.]
MTKRLVTGYVLLGCSIAMLLQAPAHATSKHAGSPDDVRSGRQVDVAQATVTVDDFVYRSDNCYSVPGAIDVSSSLPIASWEASIEVTGPRGEWADSDWVSSNLAHEEFDPLFACFYLNEFGRHTVRADVEFFDPDYNVVANVVATDTFAVQAGSNLKKTRVDRLGATAWEIRGRVRATGGITPDRNHKIRLQRFKQGRWMTTRSVLDGKGGLVVLRYSGARAGRFRLHWSGVTDVVQGDVSSTFRLP